MLVHGFAVRGCVCQAGFGERCELTVGGCSRAHAAQRPTAPAHRHGASLHPPPRDAYIPHPLARLPGNSGVPNIYFYTPNRRGTLTVSSCTFDVAAYPAIHHVGVCSLRVESSTFWSNPATAGTGAATLGAAMMVQGTLGATITNVVVASCGTVRPCMYVPTSNAAKVNVTYSLFEAQPLDKQWFKEGTINCIADLGPLQVGACAHRSNYRWTVTVQRYLSVRRVTSLCLCVRPSLSMF